MKKIGVERALTNVRQYLEDRNLEVEVLDSSNKESRKSLDRYDAIIVSGADQNLMGMEDIMTTTRIITAKGRTAEDVYNQLMIDGNLMQ